MRATLARLITARPGLTLAGALLLTVLLALPLRGARVDSSLESAVPPDHPDRLFLEKVRGTLALDEPFYVALEARPSAFDPAFLARLERLTAALAALEGVATVRSLTSARTLRGSGDALEVAPAVPAAGASPGERRLLESLARRDPLLQDVLAGDGRAVALALRLAPVRGETLEAQAQRLAREVRAAAAAALGPGVEVHLAGLPYLRGKLVATIQHELLTIGVANAAVIVLLLLLIFRHPGGVVVPLAYVSAVVVWVMGGMVLVGKGIDAYTGMVPSLILIIGVEDAIFLVSRFQEELGRLGDRRRAAAATVRALIGTCFLTSLTTALGFASIITSPVPIIREAGAVLSIGILASFLAVITIVPALLCLVPLPSLRPEWAATSRFGHALSQLGRFTATRRRLVLVLAAGLGLPIALGISKLQVESEFVRYFKDDDPVARAGRFVDDHLGGSVGFDLIVDGGREQGLLEPRLLTGMQALVTELRADPAVSVVFSLADPLLRLKEVLTGRAELPSSRAEAAQLLLLLEGGGDVLLESVTDGRRAVGRIGVRTRSLPSRELLALARRAEARARELVHPATRATGQHLLVLSTADAIVDGQIRSFGITCGGLFLIISLAFRSLSIGLLSLVPNLLPILAALAVMGFTGITLNNVTAITASVGIGIAIDNTIHLIARFRRERGADLVEAVQRTLLDVGRPTLISTMALGCGFATLMLSTFRNNSDTGAIAAVTLCFALLADLLITPALLAFHRARLLHWTGQRGEKGGPA